MSTAAVTGVPLPRVWGQRLAPERHLSVSLSPDTVAEGVRRLGWMALVYAIGNLMGPFAKLVLDAVSGQMDSAAFGLPDAFGLGAVAMAMALFAMVRARADSP